MATFRGRVTCDTLTLRHFWAYCLRVTIAPAPLRIGRAQIGRTQTGPGVEVRAIEAFLTCVARVGFSKTTVDDVAREARCSRATLYRYFEGKDGLLAEVVASEVARLSGALSAAAADQTDLESTVIAVVTTAARELRGHEALQFVIAHEPELVLGHISFAGGDEFLAVASRIVGPCIAPHLAAGVTPSDVSRAGEWIARVTLALLCSPYAPVDLTDEPATRAYFRQFVVPALGGLGHDE